jgi:DNA-binding transcriptional MerR regulator
LTKGEGQAHTLIVLTIGPFSQIAGVSPKMLRTYDAIGLFRPVWLERNSGYRYYSPAQLPEIRRILALRDLGIGLAEIARLVGGGTDLGEALARRRAELERERREVDRRLAALEIQITGDDPGTGFGDVVLRPIGAELIATISIDPRGEMIEHTFNELEAHVRDLGRRARRPPGTIEVADKQTDVYIPLTRPIAPTRRIRCERLPPIRAATIIVRGGYDRLAGGRAALARWVSAAGLAAAGPIRIVYLQYGAAPDLRLPSGYVVVEAADYVTELQMPID